MAATVGSLLGVLTAGCNQQPATPPEQPAQPTAAAPPAVKVVHPQKKDVRRLIERPGYNIEAFERTALYAKLTGYVRKWNVDMGDSVREGEILAELWIPEMDVEVRQKEAAVGQATSEIKQADAAVLRARFELERAKGQYERLARAGRSGVLGKDEVEEYLLGYQAAQAAQAKAEADVDVARARLAVAKADLEHVQTLLQYTKVRAPYDGVITGRRTINTGDFVQPASASKGEPLFIVERIKPVRVFVNVQELEAVWVHDGDAALIRVQGLPGQPFKGTVTRTSKSLHPQNRTLRTEIDLPNADGKLLPGMFVNATIIAEHKNVWSLPATAVGTQGEQSFCYRVENGKTVRTPVQVGLRGSELVEILKKQTTPSKPGVAGQWEDFGGDDVIVASDLAAVTNGQSVSVATDKK
jgi:RND family efflux transporter MFP subunit